MTKTNARIFDLTVEIHERMATVCLPGGYQEVAMRVAEIQRIARDGRVARPETPENAT